MAAYIEKTEENAMINKAVTGAAMAIPALGPYASIVAVGVGLISGPTDPTNEAFKQISEMLSKIAD